MSLTMWCKHCAEEITASEVGTKGHRGFRSAMEVMQEKVAKHANSKHPGRWLMTGEPPKKTRKRKENA